VDSKILTIVGCKTDVAHWLLIHKDSGFAVICQLPRLVSLAERLPSPLPAHAKVAFDVTQPLPLVDYSFQAVAGEVQAPQ
jgi:hypothetical protein